MEKFILALVYLLPTPLRPLAAPVADRLLSVWRWSEGLARRVRGGWGDVVTGALRIRDGARKFASEAVSTMTWISLVKIPQWMDQARTAAVAWAAARLNELRAWVSGTLEALRLWAMTRIGQALAALDALRRWVTGILAPVIDALNRTLDRVFGVLGTPSRAAEWLAAAMWSALWRYAHANIDRLASAFWPARRAIALRTVAEIDRIIGRML